MADEFTPPGASEDYPAHPTGFGPLLAEVKDIKRRLTDLPHGLLRQAGIQVTPDGMVIDSELTVTGATRIEGTLSLPAGIIDNDALTSPVSFDSARASEYNFPVTTVETGRAMSAVTVPEGYTKAIVSVFASCLVQNDSTGTQYVYLRARVDAPGGAFQYSLRHQITLAAGFWGTIVVPMIAAFESVPGGAAITGQAILSASADLSAHTSVVADSEVSATFSR